MYKPFTDLNLGFSNAENYQRRENKQLLAKYFVKDDFLDRLLDPNIYYLVGEKGTGKTAYATFLSNFDYKNYKSRIFNVRQTEYQKFLELKTRDHLQFSQYVDIWRVLLLMMVATKILEIDSTPEFFRRFTKLKDLKEVIDEFYRNAFAPEIVKMMSFVEESEQSSSLVAKHLGIGANVGVKTNHKSENSRSIFQLHLMQIRQAFESVIKTVKLQNDLLIFIDGIDVRPDSIEYSEYFECVVGLIEAVWNLNTEFLANIKDSPGMIRVVLLLRPDTLLRTGLHNLNTKIRDNSVFLNWMTTYKDYRHSMLFKVSDRLLSAQQFDAEDRNIGDAWDYYFPFFAKNVNSQRKGDKETVNSFIAFLRFSYYRPRDITTMMTILQDLAKRDSGSMDYITDKKFSDSTFRDTYAEYMLGELRDQLLFFYSQDQYDLFLQFFSHLRGKIKFTYGEFTEAFNEFVSECVTSGKNMPKFFESCDAFLQFLYEINVICYKEREEKDPETLRRLLDGASEKGLFRIWRPKFGEEWNTKFSMD